MRVDLFLGSDIGRWTLDQVEPDLVGRVATVEKTIADTAQARGITTLKGKPAALGPPVGEVGLAVHYPHVFPPQFIVGYRQMYNLHPGYLPWGRGYYPIFWALWEGTPAGATLHEISAGIDEGSIVAQRKVAYSDADTGGCLHQRVRAAEKQLFLEYWPRMTRGAELPSVPQAGPGSYHSKREFLELQKNAPWRGMSPEDLVRLVKALTFPGYPGVQIALADQCFELTLRPIPTR